MSAGAAVPSGFPAPVSDEELMDWGSRDPCVRNDVFDELYRRHHAVVQGWVAGRIRFGRDREGMIEVACQRFWMRFYASGFRQWPIDRPDRSFGPWWPRRCRWVLAEALAAMPDDEPLPVGGAVWVDPDEIDPEELAQVVIRVLCLQNEGDRRVICLRFFLSKAGGSATTATDALLHPSNNPLLQQPSPALVNAIYAGLIHEQPRTLAEVAHDCHLLNVKGEPNFGAVYRICRGFLLAVLADF